MSKSTIYGILFLCVLGFGAVGAMDYEDEVQSVKAYCDGVSQNLHPDYNRNFDALCVDK